MIHLRRESRVQHQLGLTPLLFSVDAADLRLLSEEGRERRYAVGDVIVHEGDEGSAFFIVLDGTASVSVDGATVGTLAPGDVFGEVALLRGVPRSATVVATSGLDCLLLTKWDLAAFLAGHEPVAETLRARTLYYAA